MNTAQNLARELNVHLVALSYTELLILSQTTSIDTEQDYEKETTKFTFSDGSVACFCCVDYSIVAEQLDQSAVRERSSATTAKKGNENERRYLRSYRKPWCGERMCCSRIQQLQFRIEIS